ncbi:MAG: hypothetical protein ABI216_12495 [Devosia sp.]
MRKPPIRYADISLEIRRITCLREQLILDAFAALECRHAVLAQTLLDSVGSRQRAAHWMCTNQRAFEGRSAYDVLADGNEESVWDRLPSVGLSQWLMMTDARAVH